MLFFKNVNSKQFLLLLCLTICVNACKQPALTQTKLDSTVLNALYQNNSQKPFYISSTGGDPKIAEDAAKYIVKNKIDVKVGAMCLSSCAEYILPAANNLTFKNKSIVGFHQNPLIIRHIADLSNYDGVPICNYEDRIDYLKDLHEKAFGRPDVWKAVLSKLVLKNTRLIDNVGCVEVGFSFENQLWLPNTEQFFAIFNLKIEQQLCADDYISCSVRIDRLLPQGTRIVIGDEVYTSKGR